MPIFESKGLLEGKRLRKLTDYGHVMWPFIFSQASERYARLEIDLELILQKLGHLAPILDEGRFESPIGYDPERALPVLEGIIDDYCRKLAFRYTVNGVEWMVFDKPNDMRFDYERREDIDSPAPPEPAFTEWLKSIHGENWASFHPGTVAQTSEEISRKRSEAGKAGARAKWQKNGKPRANDSTIPDLPAGANDTVPNMALVSVSSHLAVGSLVEGESNHNCTVPSGTVAITHDKSQKTTTNTKSNPTETPEQTELIKNQAIQIDGFWTSFDDLPGDNCDISNFEMLLRSNPHITVQDVQGVIMWMLCVNKDSYWLKRMTSSTDFVRAFRKMHEQYEKCGGYKVAVVAQRIAEQKADEQRLAASDGMETFKITDVDDSDGLS